MHGWDFGRQDNEEEEEVNQPLRSVGQWSRFEDQQPTRSGFWWNHQGGDAPGPGLEKSMGTRILGGHGPPKEMLRSQDRSMGNESTTMEPWSLPLCWSGVGWGGTEMGNGLSSPAESWLCSNGTAP